MGHAVGNSSKECRKGSENNDKAMLEEIGRPMCPAEISYVRMIWPLRMSQGNDLISQQVTVSHAILRDREQRTVSRKLCSCVMGVGRGGRVTD